MEEGKDRLSFRDVLSTIFQVYGARVITRETYPPYLRAVKDDITAAVGYSLSEKDASSMDMGDFLNAAEESSYTYHVFVSNNKFSLDAVRFARNHKIVLLDRQDLENEIGKTFLRDIEEFRGFRIPTDPPGNSVPRYSTGTANRHLKKQTELVELLEHYREKHKTGSSQDSSSHEKNHREAVGNNEENDMGEGEGQTDEMNGMGEGQADEMNGMGQMLNFPEISHTEKTEKERSGEEKISDGIFIMPTLSFPEIKDRCQGIGQLNAAQLELIPYFLFNYKCSNIIEGAASRRNGAGLIAVNAITSQTEEWDSGFQTTEELTVDYIRLVPRIGESVAKNLASNCVIQLNTKVIHMSSEVNGIMKKEKHKMYPEPSRIRVSHLGIYYLPHWHVKGKNGSMFVDAVNGDVISVRRG